MKLMADVEASSRVAIRLLANRPRAVNEMLRRLRDRGHNVAHQASMVKLFCTEPASRIADKTMDIFEDDGYLKRFQIEMYLRDVRLYRIFEGTSEIQRLIISRNLLKGES